MHKLISHCLICKDDKFLVLKRSMWKNENTPRRYGGYWDFPGGAVESEELPKDSLVRECLEEVNLTVKAGEILYERSNLDEGIVYTTLIYSVKDVVGDVVISHEHDDFAWCTYAEIKQSNHSYLDYILPSIERYLKVKEL